MKILLSALAFMSLLLGCGGGGGSGSGPAPVLTAPTVAITGTTTAAATGPVTLTFTFSQPMSSFPASDVVVTDGTAASTTTMIDPTHFTLVVTPAKGTGTMVITVPAGAFTDSAGVANTDAASASQPYNTWVLSWSDEFNDVDGSPPNPANWTYDIGGNGWGNNELEYYTSSPGNVQITGGNLVITARQGPYTDSNGIFYNYNYTSARLKTQGLLSWTYGRFEARIKIPYGQGMWPAFWMLGNTFSTAGWPDCGEIDIMENIGSQAATFYGSIHGPGFTVGNISTPYFLPSGKLSDDYHVYAVEWEPNQIRMYIDTILYTTYTPASLPSGGTWVFNQPFFLILNVAVGGSWPGAPDVTTVFPQKMLVDYVRVYQ
jgi:beta-glucanase (GH16 family)